MRESIDDKLHGIGIVLPEDVEIATCCLGFTLKMRGDAKDSVYIPIDIMDALYKPDGKLFWKPFYTDQPRNLEVPEKLKGRLLLFSERRVVYQGDDQNQLHLSIIPVGTDRKENSETLNLDCRLVKAVLDHSGKSLWQNPDYSA